MACEDDYKLNAIRDELYDTVVDMVNDPRLDGFCDIFLGSAMDAVTNRVFPFDDSKTYADVPARYRSRTCEIAVFLVSKMGAEGERGHSENGTSRNYASAHIPEELFEGIVPRVGVL